MPDVRMPDGTIIKNVPANATRDQIMAAHERARSSGKAPDSRPKSFWRGVGDSFHTAAGNLDKINPMSALSEAIGLGPTREQYDTKYMNSRAKGKYQGSTTGKVVGGIAATLPTLALPGGPIAQGAAGGAMLSEARDFAGMAGDVALGMVGGKLGDVVGKRVIAPVAGAVGRAIPPSIKAKGGKLVSTLMTAPRVSKGEKAIIKTAAPRTFRESALGAPSAAMAEVRKNLDDAVRLKVPYALADASPKLRTLSGSVSRRSLDGRQIADDTFTPRALAQNERVIDATERHLAPSVNIEDASKSIKDAAWKSSDPLYQKAFAQPAPDDEILRDLINTPAGREALGRARSIMENEGKNSDVIETFLREAGDSPIAPQAGRYSRGFVGDPYGDLTSGGVRGTNGVVPKRGPLDLVGWLRSRGGLADSGGELAHMGFTNAPRRGMDFVGRESEFGPLINEKGMNFDDAALNAWEAGYFPGLTERPDINDFLYAVRGTQEGWKRHFLPDDLAEVDRYAAGMAHKYDAQQARAAGNFHGEDRSVAAGFDAPQAPLSSYATEVQKNPTYETLNYVKRGLDSVLADRRNPITGKLDLEGDPMASSVNSLLQRYKGRIDELNPDYAAARAKYAEQIKPREALGLGYNQFPKASVPPRQVDAAISGMSPRELDAAKSGYATSMVDAVGNLNDTANPWSRVYGTPNKQAKIGALYPDGAKNFARQVELERDMSRTAYETIGGSPTASRLAADQQFDTNIGNAMDLGVNAMTGNPMGILRSGARWVGDTARAGVGKARADEIAPSLFNTDPATARAILEEILKKEAEKQAQRRAWGGLVGAGTVPLIIGGGAP